MHSMKLLYYIRRSRCVAESKLGTVHISVDVRIGTVHNVVVPTKTKIRSLQERGNSPLDWRFENLEHQQNFEMWIETAVL